MQNQDEETKPQDQNQDAAIKPDPETLHTTDPQDNMEGPVSSAMQKIKNIFDTDETREEADKEKSKDL